MPRSKIRFDRRYSSSAASLYNQNPDLAGGDWAVLAARAYAAALKRDPLAFWARETYAGLLMQQGKPGQAKQILEEGADYQYLGTAAVNYFVFLRRARRQAGEPERAAALERRISEITGRPVDPFVYLLSDRNYPANKARQWLVARR